VLAWIGGFVPPLQANLAVVVAAIFLYLPAALLHRRGEDGLDYGLTARPWGINLAVFAIVSTVVFPPYAVGFHVWQTRLFSARAEPSMDHYRRFTPDAGTLSAFEASWEGRPEGRPEAGTARFYLDHDRLVLEWGPPAEAGVLAGPLTATLTADGQLEVRAGKRHVRRARPEEVRVAAQGAGFLTLTVHGGERLTLDVRRGGRRVSGTAVRLGVGASMADRVPIGCSRSMTWLLWLVLTQVLLIAIPEEFFYRGYLQGTLERALRGRVAGPRMRVAVAILITSALFGLGHFLVDFEPQRLAVFFPSLLFGAMRVWTGSIGAAVLFHAASNIVVDLLSKSYVWT